jgi:hypothetical protein
VILSLLRSTAFADPAADGGWSRIIPVVANCRCQSESAIIAVRQSGTEDAMNQPTTHDISILYVGYRRPAPESKRLVVHNLAKALKGASAVFVGRRG